MIDPSAVSWIELLVVQDRLDQSEVEQLGHVVDAAPLGGEDVARLDVAVDQPGRVGLAQGVAGLAQQVDHPLRRHRAEPLDQLAEAHAGQVLHDVVERAVVGAAVVEDLDRVPVR